MFLLYCSLQAKQVQVWKNSNNNVYIKHFPRSVSHEWFRYSGICHCVIGWVGPHISKDHSAFIFKGQAVRNLYLCSSKRLGPTHSRKQHHIPGDLNHQQLQCENLNFVGHTKCSLTFIRSSRRNSLWTFSLRGLSSCGFKVNNSWMAALNVTRLKLEYI